METYEEFTPSSFIEGSFCPITLPQDDEGPRIVQESTGVGYDRIFVVNGITHWD